MTLIAIFCAVEVTYFLELVADFIQLHVQIRNCMKVLCRTGHTLLLASDTMRLTDPSRKLCRRRGET